MRATVARLGELVGVLLLVSLGTFLLVSFLPGDPAIAILGEGHPPERYAEVRAQLGLDDPLPRRYVEWLGSAVTGDFGTSLVPPHAEVADRLRSALPISIEIAVLGMGMALLFAIPLAMWSAARQNRAADRVIGASMFGLLSTPPFLAGLLLILVLVNEWGLFPRTQWVRLSEDPIANLHHAFLPALVIALMEVALFTRVLRGDLVVTLRENYVLASRARGNHPMRILVSDALRPSAFSLVTVMGISIGRLIGSTVIVETLFAIPGMGTLIVGAATQGDLPTIQGAVLVIAVIYVGVNALTDASYGLLDPRTRHAHTP